MYFPLFAAVELPRWEILAISSLGLFSAGLCLAAGRMVLNRRREAAAAEAQKIDFSLGGQLQGKDAERRTSVRRPGAGIKCRIENSIPTMGTLVGRVMDRSEGGMGLLLTEELPAGVVLFLHPEGAAENLPWIKLVVTHKRWDGCYWETGCRFEGKPARMVLDLLK